MIVLLLATPLVGFALLLFMQRLEERMMAAPAQVTSTPLEEAVALQATTLATAKWSAGIGVCSRHVMAIGRSPRCST